MSPPYQRRGRIWNKSDKGFLIDSILNDYDIPKVYLADFTYGDSELNYAKLPYAVIDGKQRFEAIFDFYDGKIVLNDDFVFLDSPNMNLAGLGYRDLHRQYPEVVEKFDNFPLSVMSVISSGDARINDMFIRLNRSKPLTGAEVRNAMRGPVPGLIREISTHDFFENYIKFSTSRGADHNAAAKILMFEYYGQPKETKKRLLDSFVKEAGDGEKDRLELVARRCVENLDSLTEVFLPSDALLSSAGAVPVYYWFVSNIQDSLHPHIRPFLANFETRRKKQRADLRKGGVSGSPVRYLADYDNYNRSTNDVASHEGRIKILFQQFEKYLKRESVQYDLLTLDRRRVPYIDS
ncbi:MAG: DUF262 domain-containing protein [Phycisphaerales bacterium]|nr:DUF262 domain-containing protein [Phycisphaerales bacterium]